MCFRRVSAAAMRLVPQKNPRAARDRKGDAGDRTAAASGLTMLQQGNASAPIRNRPARQPARFMNSKPQHRLSGSK
jgi:hypothetical protein